MITQITTTTILILIYLIITAIDHYESGMFNGKTILSEKTCIYCLIDKIKRN